jgi:hypothetical protein
MKLRAVRSFSQSQLNSVKHIKDLSPRTDGKVGRQVTAQTRCGLSPWPLLSYVFLSTSMNGFFLKLGKNQHFAGAAESNKARK